MNQISIYCPKCNRYPKTAQNVGEAFISYTCYEDCAFQFWSLKICTMCENPQKTILINKPNLGQKITCQSCDHSSYYFRCPNADCKMLFFKKQYQYKMGSLVECQFCKIHFKLITCTCGGDIQFHEQSLLFEGYTQMNCKCCKKNFFYTVCPDCRTPDFHMDKLEIGDRIKCHSCKAWRKYVPCPTCGQSTKGNTFSFCAPNHCQNCNIVFQYSRCPYGCSGINYNTLEHSINPERECFSCKKKYFAINCNKCQHTLYLQTVTKSVGTIQFCPSCKHQICYYHCGKCLMFNNEMPRCINNGCPKPIEVLDKTKIKENNPVRDQKGPEISECKICMQENSTMINAICGHILMCQKCVRKIQATKHNVNFQCPVCKAIGPYFKYKKPIYS